MIERIAHDQLNKFLAENDNLYKLQSGFRPNHSANLCLSHLIDKILKGFAENLLTGMIIIETFDTKTFCYKNLTQSNS